MGDDQETAQARLQELEQSGKFEAYQKAAGVTAVYPNAGRCILYPAFGLAGELGEVMELVLAAYRGPEVGPGTDLVGDVLELVWRVGRVAEVVKKGYRDSLHASFVGGGCIVYSRRQAAIRELQRIAAVAEMLQYTLTHTAQFDFPELTFSVDASAGLEKELGDLQWYVAQFATEAGLSLEDLVIANARKLANRAERGTLHGSGNDR